MLGGISLWQLAIVLVIVILLFGTKKLRNIGGDLGNAVKGFKKAIGDDEAKATADDKPAATANDDSPQLKKDDADFAAQDKPAVNEDKKNQP